MKNTNDENDEKVEFSIVILRNKTDFSVAFLNASTIEDAQKIMDEGGEEVIDVIEFPRDTESSHVVAALIECHSEQDESFCHEIENLLSMILNIGIKIGRTTLEE